MEVYKLDATITRDGKIILPGTFKRMFNHRVEVILKRKDEKVPKKALAIPSFLCGGKLADFDRAELYEDRF